VQRIIAEKKYSDKAKGRTGEFAAQRARVSSHVFRISRARNATDEKQRSVSVRTKSAVVRSRGVLKTRFTEQISTALTFYLYFSRFSGIIGEISSQELSRSAQEEKLEIRSDLGES